MQKEKIRTFVDHTLTILVTGFVVTGIGFFVDFQFLKSRVSAMEDQVETIPQIEVKIDKVRGLMCEGEMMRPQVDPEILKKYCVKDK